MNLLDKQWSLITKFTGDSVAPAETSSKDFLKVTYKVADTTVMADLNELAVCEQIKNFLQKREIHEILHFTPQDNLSSILDNGLWPRNHLENLPILEVKFPDKVRRDGNIDRYCLSISFPNYKMFHHKRETLGGKWIVLKINPETIIKHSGLFFKTNAGTSVGLKTGNTTIENLFYDLNLREELNLPNYFTTNPQAEVQIRSRTPPELIEAIYTDSRNTDDNFRMIKRMLREKNLENQIKLISSNSYFGPRRDHAYWQRTLEIHTN
jgi:hypothetical protein